MSDISNIDTTLNLNAQVGKASSVTTPSLAAATAGYAIGDIIDGAYVLKRSLGQGGMGAVFSCHHQALDRDFAIKLLSRKQLTSQAWSRFESEAKVLAKLKHPNIIGIYNMGIDKGQCPYIVMELLEGQTLDALIRERGHLTVTRALDIFINIANALQSAHAQGVIHRDIKPSNLILCQDMLSKLPTVKVVDFGIARDGKNDRQNQSQTATGLIFGTPYYMSPEQCRGLRVDHRADIYSFGCTLFEALTGRPPLVGESALETYMMHQFDPPPSLQAATKKSGGLAVHAIAFPAALELAVQRMLSKDVATRYQTMEQVSHDLQRIREGKSIAGLDEAIVDRWQNNFDPDSDDHYNDDQSNQLQAREYQSQTLNRLTKNKKSIALILLVLALAFLIAWPFYHNLKSAPAAQRSAEKALLGAPPAANKPADLTGSDLEVAEDSANLHEDVPGRPGKLLTAFGATDSELHDVSPKKVSSMQQAMHAAEVVYIEHLKNPRFVTGKFGANKQLHFPVDIVVGCIAIGNSPLCFASGNVPLTAHQDTTLFFSPSLRKYPQILQKFWSDDLTGLALATDNPTEVLKITANWKRLKELDFFNPIIKSLPGQNEALDESKISDNDLPAIDNFALTHSLQTLGLCAPVSGPAIERMSAIRQLSCLKLKRVENLNPLLSTLTHGNNLKELWLIHQGTNNKQLEELAKIKSLERLTILRSALSLNSLPYFQKMTNLRTLRLDRNDWTFAQKANFQRQLPNCHVSYEAVADSTYWKMTTYMPVDSF